MWYKGKGSRYIVDSLVFVLEHGFRRISARIPYKVFYGHEDPNFPTFWHPRYMIMKSAWHQVRAGWVGKIRLRSGPEEFLIHTLHPRYALRDQVLTFHILSKIVVYITTTRKPSNLQYQDTAVGTSQPIEVILCA